MIKETTWDIEPHTEIKHEILKRYLDAWIPIISKFGVVNYIDGFAGPGKYNNKKYGSPIIAIKSLIEHKLSSQINAKFNFLFIEQNPERYNSLKEEISKLNIPSDKCKISVECGEFEEKLNKILDFIEEKKSKIAPTFVFIDPFGIKGVSMSTIRRVMSYSSCEVLITFMYEELNRFITLPQNELNVTALFGDDTSWKSVKPLEDSTQRYKFLTELYKEKLQENCGDCFVLPFSMENKFNKKDYVLFFCTKNKKGLVKMKESMWKVDESGNFTFSDATFNPKQKLLFEKQPNFNELKNLIISEYHNKSIPIEELINFVEAKTLFLERHIKKPILYPMEQKGEIEVILNKKRSKATYPAGTIIKFL
ncbi:MAG: three-Cys-motif partner protein TcmP [archaeon]